jgi:uncharacterized protein (DUF1015 family)
MSQIQPFRAYRPKPEFAAEVASVPYDVIDTKEARALAAGKPRSFLHVGRPEINLPEGVDEHSDEVYQAGVKALRGFIADGTLLREERPSFYVYQQKMGAHVQAGLVCLCSVREYEAGTIKRHELTRKDKEDDRTRHVTEQAANAEPVFLAYRAVAGIDAIVARVRQQKPLYDIVTPDGIGHVVWTIGQTADVQAIGQLFAKVPALYIADGHHRTAAAIRFGQARRKAAGAAAKPDAPYESFMAVVFPHDQLRILDYNRVVKDLNGLDKATFLTKVKERFDVAPNPGRTPAGSKQFGMYLDGQWSLLRAKPGTYDPKDAIGSLDVSILQNNLLALVLGIQDPRTDKRIDFVGGIRGTDELERRVKANGKGVAFSLFPTSMDQLMAVADAGQIMPPKSTWFEPKLRSGLLVRTYDE